MALFYFNIIIMFITINVGIFLVLKRLKFWNKKKSKINEIYFLTVD